MKKIYFFEDVLGVGGIESYIVSVIRHIDPEKYKVILVLSNKDTDHYDGFFEAAGVDVRVLQGRCTDPVKRYLSGIRKFGEFLKSEGADNMYFNCSSAVDLLYIQTAKRNGVKVRIAHCHNDCVTSFVKKAAHAVIKPFLSGAPTKRYACSVMAAKWLFSGKAIKNGEYEIIKNAIEAEKFIYSPEKRDEIRKELGLGDDFVIGHVGRFNIQKNHRFIFQLFPKVKEAVPNARLLLVGEGELKESFMRLSEELGISDSVIFYGVSGKVHELMQAMDIFIFPSLFEGLGIAAIEAQASGLKTLCSDRVPRETDITENIEYLPPDIGVWSGRITDIYRQGYERKNTYNGICAHGFDDSSLAAAAEKICGEIS